MPFGCAGGGQRMNVVPSQPFRNRINKDMDQKSVSELYIEEIINNLRAHHAAVLVGAGFSRNAERIDGANKHMPGWDELADIFCNQLGMDKNIVRYTDPLSLAQEVEVLYGKPYLNNLLRNLMDDDSYRPGFAHDLLMNLPWMDVFTTNYDTLLERAYQNGMSTQRYKIVLSQGDLLYSAGTPRIIKLHGSFPSYEPFIISEEDYRRYPIDNAPFVNTVQQALLENLFILIGFSGTDPNFLKWIGWIHDNLSLKNSPRIYMVVHEAKSAVRKKMLAAKNIDFVVLNDIDRFKHSDYRVSIRLFLEELNRKVDKKSGGDKFWPEYHSRLFQANSDRILSELKRIHNSYPGWLFAKFQSFPDLRFILTDVEFYIRRQGSDKNAAQDADTSTEKKDKSSSEGCAALELAICSEYCWLIEISGSYGDPNFSDVIKALNRILERHSKERRTDDYINIQFSILHYYRLIGDEEWEGLFDELKKKIRKHEIWNEYYARLCYENAMYQLYSFKWNHLEEAVRQIPCDNEHSEWTIKKAGMLSLVGLYQEALELLTEGITYARRVLLKGVEKGTFTYNRYTSLESSMMSLYGYIKQAYKSAVGWDYDAVVDSGDADEEGVVDKVNNISGANSADDLSEVDADSGLGDTATTTMSMGVKVDIKVPGTVRRTGSESDKKKAWRSKKVDDYEMAYSYKSDYIWEIENNKYVGKMSETYMPKPSVRENPTFDVGRMSSVTHFGGDNESMLAMQFLSFREATGHPFRIGSVTDKEGIIGAISRLNWCCYRSALLLAIVSGENKTADTALTRMSLASIPSEDINRLSYELAALLRYAMVVRSTRTRSTYFDNIIQDYALYTIPEFLSRLTVKCSPSVFDTLVDIITELYSFKDTDAFIKIKNLVARTIELMPLSSLIDNLHRLWRIDIMPDKPHLTTNYPDPFSYAHLRLQEDGLGKKLKMDKEQERIVSSLIERASEAIYKKPAISRLSFIYRIYEMPNALVNGFKKLIWDNSSVDKYGLPELGVFFKVLADEFPHDEGDDEKLLSSGEKYVVGKYREIIDKKMLYDYTDLFHMTQRLIEKMAVSEEKAVKGCKLALEFARTMQENINHAVSFGFYDAKRSLGSIDEILGSFLLKSGLLSSAESIKNKDIKNYVAEVVQILEECESPHALLSWCIASDDRYKEIRSSVLKQDDAYRRNANWAMYYLLDQGIGIDDKMVTLMTDSVVTTLAYNVNTYALGLEHMIRNDLLDKEKCDLVADSLEKFDTITRFNVLDSDKVVMDKLAMRKVTSILAHTLLGWYMKIGVDAPDGVKHWQELSKDPEEFAEIRLVWDEDSAAACV